MTRAARLPLPALGVPDALPRPTPNATFLHSSPGSPRSHLGLTSNSGVTHGKSGRH